MKITGNKKVDTALKIGAVGLLVYIGYKAYKKSRFILQSPLSPLPVPTNPLCPPINALRQMTIKNEMDRIYTHVQGWNFFYYPEYINVIVGYTDCELDFAVNYYAQTYGENLREHIEGEWDAGWYYTPAINRLKNAGF